MGFDSCSPISPASLNVLLLPAGPLKSERFEELVSLLLKHTIISLGDVVTNDQIAKRPGLFSPTVFAAGRVLLRYSTSIETQWIDSFPYELNRTPQVVLALSDESISTTSGSNGTQTTRDIETVATEFDDLLESFRDSVDQDQRPLVHCLAIFEPASAKTLDRRLTWCSVTGNRQSGTVSDFVLSVTAAVLDAFDDLAKDYKDAVIRSPHLIRQRAANGQGPIAKTGFPQSSRLPPETSQTPVVTNGGEKSTETSSNDGSRSASRSRFGFASPATAASTDSLPDNTRARYQILLGNLYLQAGRWPDALRELSEGAVSTRGHVVDTIWHAHALECLMVCMAMFAWADIDFNIPQICYASVDKSQGGRWASLASQMTGSTSAESSVASLQSLTKLVPSMHDVLLGLHMNVSSTAQEQLPVLMLAELKIRQASMLAAICLSGGTLDKAALDHLVAGIMLKAGPLTQVGPPTVSLRKNLIATLLADAVEELPSNFPSKSFINLVIAVSSWLSRLGLDRREAFYLKSLLQQLRPGLINARKIGAAELGIHPAAALSLQGSAASGTSSIVRSGVQSILESVCEAYGLPRILTFTEQAAFEIQDLAAIKSTVLKWSDMQASGDFLIKLEVLRLCAGVCEALPDLASGLQYNTQLLAFSKRNVTISIDTKSESSYISQDEQMKLLNTIKRTVTTANKLGMPTLRARYWDYFLVRGVDLLEPQPSERLVPHTPQELSLVTATAKKGTKDPFIYNPLAPIQKHDSGGAVLVTGEMAYFSVILQNPFEFDVEVDSISILAEGCDFEATTHNIVLGHCCAQRFILSGVPRSEGLLKVAGCRARIKDCYEQDFLILSRPFIPSRSVKQRGLPHRKMTATLSKTLPNSISQSESAVEISPDMDITATTLPISVIRAQPKLSIERTSLSSSSLMLLEGETKRVEITLKNNSNEVSADLVLFTFDDSVTRQVQEALTNKNLSPSELYELQLQLTESPALRWLADDGPPSLQPGQSRSFTFEVTGKPGLMDSTIQVNYANLGFPRSEVKDMFYMRQILLSIAVTVNGSIEIPRCNIVPFLNDETRTKFSSTARTTGRVQDTDANGHCIILLDFRNVWPYPLAISLQTSEDSASQLVRSSSLQGHNGNLETLQPGHVFRNVLAVPRIFVSDPHAPVPAIGTQRQFVVSASKVSIEAEAASREAFWYREELLKSIKASWKEHGTGRYGVIDVRRGIRLSTRMIEALKMDSVDIRFVAPKVVDATGLKDHDEPLQLSETSPLTLAVGTFGKIVVKVHNRSQKRLQLLLRLQPSLRDEPHTLALDLSKRLAWSGMLQRPLHPSLGPGETREAELGVTALASGRFEISATVEEIKAGKSERHIEDAGVVSVGSERMIWHAREQCLINAVSFLES